MQESYTIVYSTPITKLEYALWVEARRQLLWWWPSGESHFWVDRVALFAVVGDRALPGAGGDAELHRRVLAQFDETASLEKAAIIPQGWRVVPCPPTEQMLKAGLAAWPDPQAGPPRSLIKRLQVWYATKRRQRRGEVLPERDAQLRWLEERRTMLTTNFLAMVDKAPPPPPWDRA